MNQSFPNIEKSAFRRGEYVGYAHGAWRITGRSGEWRATPNAGTDGRAPITGATLADLSEQLTQQNRSPQP
jgi:hypothetical protein